MAEASMLEIGAAGSSLDRGRGQPHPRPISSVDPDWSRERPPVWYDPSRRLLASIRRYQRYADRPGLRAAIGRKLAVLQYRIWSIVTGAEVPLRAQIGGGLLMPHPQGIVIHPETVIGPNCIIFQNVTLGTNGPTKGPPTLEGHVDVGPGACILGPVTIGAHAQIAANAVVTKSVPPHAIVAGVPARLIGWRYADGSRVEPPGPIDAPELSA